jgi:hypothetical protein
VASVVVTVVVAVPLPSSGLRVAPGDIFSVPGARVVALGAAVDAVRDGAGSEAFGTAVGGIAGCFAGGMFGAVVVVPRGAAVVVPPGAADAGRRLLRRTGGGRRLAVGPLGAFVDG